MNSRRRIDIPAAHSQTSYRRLGALLEPHRISGFGGRNFEMM
jgi:hypothetical protein